MKKLKIQKQTGYIVGYGHFGNTETDEHLYIPWPKGLPADEDGMIPFRDEFGNFQYKWTGSEIKLEPQTPTTEQIQARKERYIIEKKRKLYSKEKEEIIRTKAFNAFLDNASIPEEYLKMKEEIKQIEKEAEERYGK